MPYRTEHFRIYYDSSVIGRAEIEEIGINDEKLLVHVNSYLGTSFDGIITSILTDSIHRSHMDYYNLTHNETVYGRNDDGHEIAHVVSLSSWGRSNLNFFVEGLAQAAQTHTPDDAITDFNRQFINRSDRQAYLDTLLNHLYLDIVADEFHYEYIEYIGTGAFVEYLHKTYGIRKVKEWWLLTVARSNRSETDNFYSVFNVSLTTTIAAFSDEVKSRAPFK